LVAPDGMFAMAEANRIIRGALAYASSRSRTSRARSSRVMRLVQF
jgi:hypothetical protein